MNYMLLIYQDGEPAHAPEVAGVPGCAQGIADDLAKTGRYVSAGVLKPAAMATSVRMRDGQRLVTDGPYAETREQLAGYLIVDAESLEEAIAVAAAHPVSLTGTIEIRPVVPISANP